MSAEEFTPEDRRKCLIRLHRILAWVGAQYPETLYLPCGRVHLRDVIFDLLTKKTLSNKDLNDIEALKHSLQEMRLKKEKELETLELTISEGRKLCREVEALIRALISLKDVTKKRRKRVFYQELRENRIMDEKRWIKYLEEVKK